MINPFYIERYSHFEFHGALSGLGVRFAVLERMTEEQVRDRRSHERFEVVGQLWGYFTTNDLLRTRDISEGGVLAIAASQLSEGSMHTTSVKSPRWVGNLRMRVRRSRLESSLSGRSQYLVGLQCVHQDRGSLAQAVKLLTSDAEQ